MNNIIPFSKASYGTVLRNARLQKGYSRKELSEMLGVHFKSISNWEADKGSPDFATIEKICKILDLHVDTLFGVGPAYSPNEQDHIHTLRLLSASSRRAIMMTAKSLLESETEEQEGLIKEMAMEVPALSRIILSSGHLAAGPDTGLEEEIAGEPLYLFSSPAVERADLVIRVNGDSMLPEYRNGDYVLVQRLYSQTDLKYGETGAFSNGNENYLKIYEKDGLHSMNPAFPVMHFSDGDRVQIIGRVTGRLDIEKDLPSQADLAAYSIAHPELGEIHNPAL